MLVMHGSRERTGCRPTRVIPTTAAFSLIGGAPI